MTWCMYIHTYIFSVARQSCVHRPTHTLAHTPSHSLTPPWWVPSIKIEPSEFGNCNSMFCMCRLDPLPCPYSHAYLMRSRPPFLCGWTHTLPEDRQHQGAGSTNMIQVIHTMPPESESIKSRIRTVPLVYIRPQIHSSTATTLLVPTSTESRLVVEGTSFMPHAPNERTSALRHTTTTSRVQSNRGW